MFYTGISDARTFASLFDEVNGAYSCTRRKGDGADSGRTRKLRLIDEFSLVMMRIRLDLLLENISCRFHISKSTCGLIVNKWISYLSTKLSFLCPWPLNRIIMNHMPLQFKRKYSSCRVIIDCTAF